MIQTPPVPKGATVQQGPGINGGSQAGTIGIAPKRSTTGSGLKSRAKGAIHISCLSEKQSEC